MAEFILIYATLVAELYICFDIVSGVLHQLSKESLMFLLLFFYFQACCYQISSSLLQSIADFLLFSMTSDI